MYYVFLIIVMFIYVIICFFLLSSASDFCVSWLLQISRDSIDTLKKYFRDDVQKSDWQLIIELKKLFEIL